MSDWTRADDAGTWSQSFPIGTAVALLVGALAAALPLVRWTPTQRALLPVYLKSQIAVAVQAQPRTYTLPGRPAGATYDNATVQAWLRQDVYQGRDLSELARVSSYTGAIALFVGLLYGVPTDVARVRANRLGRRIAGVEQVTAQAFNDVVRGDGLPIVQARGPALRIPRRKEPQHVSIQGGAGAGKSTVIRDVLVYVEARGDIAVVIDQAREFLPQFWRPTSIVLNPLDARCPHWPIGDELAVDEDQALREAEALTVGAALFPPNAHRGSDKEFFVDAAQSIFAKLLAHRDERGRSYTAHQIADILANGARLDALLAGVGEAWAIDQNAGPQRGGVIASLNQAQKTLRLLPARERTTTSWTAREWAASPSGWLFLTSNPEARKAQVPLLSLWVDLLLLRLMNPERRGPRVWFIVDEWASLQFMPQMAMAMREARKANIVIVVGFQSAADIRATYGDDTAESMLSQPATKVMLKTTDPAGAKRVADQIGQIETERYSPSRSRRFMQPATDTVGLHREVKLLVLPSQVQGWPDLQGVLKYENYVVPLQLAYHTRPAVTEGFIRREVLPLLSRGEEPGLTNVVTGEWEPTGPPVRGMRGLVAGVDVVEDWKPTS